MLILKFRAIFGAHFNPVVMLPSLAQGAVKAENSIIDIIAKIIGAIINVTTANIISDRDIDNNIWPSKIQKDKLVASEVGAYITAAC